MLCLGVMMESDGQTSLVGESYSSATEIATLLLDALERVIIGKQSFLELFVAAILAKGHVLIEDLPGLGKTTVAKAFSRLIARPDGAGLEFRRIQCTPDLLPYDITGVEVFDPGERAFRFVPGPIFADVVLADELNRATPKTQSALLEALSEGQVTVGLTTRSLPDPFVLIATQNPVESEGTFPLPAAQLDRFTVRLSMGYPDRAIERAVVEGNPGELILHGLEPVTSTEEVREARAAVPSVYCAPPLLDGLVDTVRGLREHRSVAMGPSPRAALQFIALAKAYAALKGRGFVIDEDLFQTAPAALAHRLKMRDPRIQPEAVVREVVLERIESIRRAR